MFLPGFDSLLFYKNLSRVINRFLFSPPLSHPLLLFLVMCPFTRACVLPLTPPHLLPGHGPARAL